MYLILCVDDIIWCWGQKVFCPQLMSTNCSAASCSRNSANIRNPLICYTNHSFLMFGGSQVQTPYHASMNGVLTFWPWHHNIKIFVENSALFYYEKSKVYSKWILRCGRAASPVWREPPVRTNGATLFCLLSYFAIAGSIPYTSLIERSLDGSTLSISIL